MKQFPGGKYAEPQRFNLGCLEFRIRSLILQDQKSSWPNRKTSLKECGVLNPCGRIASEERRFGYHRLGAYRR